MNDKDNKPKETPQTHSAMLVDLQKKIVKVEDLAKKGSMPGCFIPADLSYLDLTEYLRKNAEEPHRKMIDISFSDAVSFILYVKEQKSSTTRIFAVLALGTTGASPSFNAILDFQGTEASATSWMTHEATLMLELTPEMQRWLDAQAVKFDQLHFAEFLEDNLSDITDPRAADVLEVVHNLHAKKDVQFRSALRQETGDVKFLFEETTESSGAGPKGDMEIPTRFRIEVAPFVGSDIEVIEARFKYRIHAGQLVFSYKLLQVEKLLEASVRAISEKIHTETEVPVYYGSVDRRNEF